MKKDDLILYHKYALRLLDKLETVKLEHVPSSANKMADALVNLIATLAWGQKKTLLRQFVANGSSHVQKMEMKKTSK